MIVIASLLNKEMKKMINNKFIVYEDNKNKASSGEDIFNRIKEIKINYEQENFIVFFLNNQNRILKEENLFKGGFESCMSYFDATTVDEFKRNVTVESL